MPLGGGRYEADASLTVGEVFDRMDFEPEHEDEDLELSLIHIYRPLPPGADGQHPPLSRLLGAAGEDKLQAPDAGADTFRRLRLHSISGTGHRDIPASRGLLAGPGGHDTPRHVEKEARGHRLSLIHISFEDVLRLMAHIEKTVFEKSGVRLEPEVRILKG